MVFKLTIEKEIIDTLYKIKKELYGEDSNRIRNAFLLSKMILQKNYSKQEVNFTLQKFGVESYGPKMATTMNFNQEAYDVLKKMSNEMSLSMAEVVRAVILINDGKEIENEKVNMTVLEFASQLNSQFHEERVTFPLKEENSVIKVFRGWNENKVAEYENSAKAKELYKYLSWNEFAYYDIINSFWKPFLCKAAITENEKTSPLFKFLDNYKNIEMDISSKNEKEKYISTIKKEYFVENFINFIDKNKDHLGNRSDDKKNLMNIIINDKSMCEYAVIIYTLPNFMPVPDKDFNSKKGCIANDSLPIMLDIIEDCINKNEDLKVNNDSIKIDQIKEWKQWFLKNREKALLQDYYIIVEDKIIPIKEFTNQSISHPIPTSSSEFEEFISMLKMKHSSRRARFIEYMMSNQI